MKTNSLRCEKCGSRNTVIISKKEAAEACKDPTIMCSKSGTIDLKIIVDLYNAAFSGSVRYFAHICF